MEQLTLGIIEKSKIKIIASSGHSFQIELVEKIGRDDIPKVIEVSEILAKKFGKKWLLGKNNINKYFNQDTLPFIARFRNEIIGYIIGVPLEYFKNESWARIDVNLNKNNTLYTYAFVVDSEFKGNGYAKMLKRVFLSWAEKNNQIDFITGHVINGISAQFTGDIRIVNRIENWQGTGKSFEYYRRNITSKGALEKNDPPLINRT